MLAYHWIYQPISTAPYTWQFILTLIPMPYQPHWYTHVPFGPSFWTTTLYVHLTGEHPSQYTYAPLYSILANCNIASASILAICNTLSASVLLASHTPSAQLSCPLDPKYRVCNWSLPGLYSILIASSNYSMLYIACVIHIPHSVVTIIRHGNFVHMQHH